MGKYFLQFLRGIYDLSSSLLSTLYDAAFRATILEAKTVCYNIQCSAVWPLHSASAELTQQSSQNTTADLSVLQLYLLPLIYQFCHLTVLTKGATNILNESSILIEGVLMCCNMSTMQTLQITVLQWSEKHSAYCLKESVKKCTSVFIRI